MVSCISNTLNAEMVYVHTKTCKNVRIVHTFTLENVTLLCLTDHSVRYIVFHRVLVFLATSMCYIPFERIFDVD